MKQGLIHDGAIGRVRRVPRISPASSGLCPGAFRKGIRPCRIFVLLSVTFAMTGCRSGEREPGGEALAEVRLGAGIPYALSAKSPIEGGAMFTASVAGWETSQAVDYYSDTAWYSSSHIEASPNPVAISLEPRQYYSPDNAVRTYIKAWHPEACPESGIVRFENDSATLDVMLTPGAAVGSKLDAEGKHLQFEHLTTQLKFVVQADFSLDPGTTLRYIRIKGASIPVGIDLSDNRLLSDPAGADGLEVPGIGMQDTIRTSPEAVGRPLMVEPMAGNTVALDVATSGASFENVTATVNDTDFRPGTAYTITLTFRQGGISLTAAITPWKEEDGWGDIIM